MINNSCLVKEKRKTFLSPHVSTLCLFFLISQRHPAAAVQLQGNGDPAGHGGGRFGRSPGRRTDLWHLPQDQVCRRLWEPVLLLPDQVLRPLWRTSFSAIQHSKRERSHLVVQVCLTPLKTTKCRFTPRALFFS